MATELQNVVQLKEVAPLGLLAPLAAGERPAGMEAALAMTDALRKELPRMLEEHERIRSATEKLRAVAREAKASVHEQFAEDLALHARTEEEVLYPAAILVGDIIRLRLAQKSTDREREMRCRAAQVGISEVLSIARCLASR